MSRAVTGTIVTGIGIAVGAYGIRGPLPLEQSVAVTFLGGFVIFVGIVVLGPLVARRLAAFVGRPLPLMFGVTGVLARGNAMRNPKRTTVTAAALIVGLALVALVSIFGASLRSSVGTSLQDVKSEIIITAPGYAGFSPEVRDPRAGGGGRRPGGRVPLGAGRRSAGTRRRSTA